MEDGEIETPDRCWKWRVFYVNPNDRAIFVKKRYGIGYTLNFGNRWSWAVVALILVAVILPFSVPAFFIFEIKHHLVH